MTHSWWCPAGHVGDFGVNTWRFSPSCSFTSEIHGYSEGFSLFHIVSSRFAQWKKHHETSMVILNDFDWFSMCLVGRHLRGCHWRTMSMLYDAATPSLPFYTLGIWVCPGFCSDIDGKPWETPFRKWSGFPLRTVRHSGGFFPQKKMGFPMTGATSNPWEIHQLTGPRNPWWIWPPLLILGPRQRWQRRAGGELAWIGYKILKKLACWVGSCNFLILFVTCARAHLRL